MVSYGVEKEVKDLGEEKLKVYMRELLIASSKERRVQYGKEQRA